jgi:tRNA threonylcarbamoyl adenosine modification protein YeaZ/ribosomal-protein-alanine acetyltransferase
MLLVIDTCFNACSAALYDEVTASVVASEYQEMDRGQAEALGPMVERLFAGSNVKPEHLTRIAVTYGPGTFTGLRIGLSFAKGMALALDIPLVRLNSLKATAQHMGKEKVIIAHRAGGTGLYYWTSPEGPALGSVHDIETAAKKLNRAVVGSGFPGAKTLWPDAKIFAGFAATLPVSEDEVEPLYLREPDAKPSVPANLSSASIRLVTNDDLAGLAVIHGESFAAGWDEQSIGTSLGLPGAAALVVELAGIVYGFVMYQHIAGEAEILTLCVSPNFRRQHFGDQLLGGVIAKLRTEKVTKLFLEVAADNQAALSLYGRFGFARTGLRRGYYQRQDRAAVDAMG